MQVCTYRHTTYVFINTYMAKVFRFFLLLLSFKGGPRTIYWFGD